ncbi:MAG: CBS domain-containing protein [Polyangiaceae bacterium]
MEVQKIMSRGIRTCSPEDAMSRAAQIMWENDCGVVPVVDAEGRVTSMITDRDICMATLLACRPPGELQVSMAASRTIVKVREHDSVEIAEALMQEHQVRRLPVVDAQDRLVGVLSMNDLARSFQMSDGGTVSQREVARTLAAVSQPHHEAPSSASGARTERGAQAQRRAS